MHFLWIRIMDLAQEKYKILVDKDEWEAPSPEQKDIVALESQLTDVRKELRKVNSSKSRRYHERKGQEKAQGYPEGHQT